MDPARLDPAVVVVVDNDHGGSAREVAATAAADMPWPVTYVVEPERGISFARNRAVRVALSWGADFVAFIDDDEIADPGWLAELAGVQQREGADVVTGPVLPIYEPGVPAWAVRGGFFERPRYPSGTRLGSAGAGNCLIAAALLGGPGEPFDPAFALSGGEDTHFFRRAHRGGATIVWADQAVAHEHVPVSRATVPWLLQRSYRSGLSFAMSDRRLHHDRSWIPRRILAGVARAVQGIGLLLPFAFRGRVGVIRALQVASLGAGVVAGTLGFSYQEYQVVHGE